MLSLRDKFISYLWFLAARCYQAGFAGRMLGLPIIVTHYLVCVVSGNDLSANVLMSHPVRIYHAVGMVVGSHCVFEKNVTIRARVTLGEDRSGSCTAPILREGVALGVNVSIFGSVTIEPGRFVKAGSMISKNV